jgi:hypothetical protein
MSSKPSISDYVWYASKCVSEKVSKVVVDSATAVVSSLGATITKDHKGVSITLPKTDSG